MKKIIIFIIVIFCLIVVGYFAFNDNQKSSNSYIIGADTTFPPFEYEEDGQLKGFDIDIINAIAKKENLKITIQAMQFSGIIPGLQGGTIDAVVAGITIKQERSKVVDFSDAYYKSGLSILVKKDSRIGGVNDLNGQIVATKKATSSVDYLRNNKNIKPQQILQFNNIVDAYNVLLSDGANAVLFDNPVNLNFIAQDDNASQYKIVGPLLIGEYYGIAVSQKNPELLAKIQRGLKAIQADGSYARIYKKYFVDNRSGMVLTAISPQQAINMSHS